MQPDLNDPYVTAALGSALTAFLVWVSGRGWPVIEKGWAMIKGRHKEIRDEAKEGPLMVLERVENELTRCQEMLASALAELTAIRQKYFDCETDKAALRTEVKFLREKHGDPDPAT